MNQPLNRPEVGEPAWDIARLFPNQGHWSEAEYFALDTNHLVEFSRGRVDVLPMPTTSHQFIVQFLFEVLKAFVKASQLGWVAFSPLRVKLWEGQYREPDVLFMRAEHAGRLGEQYWDGADLVMEVVSPENRDHDLVTKRAEYAQAGIPEYWVVDPQESCITVLRLEGDAYAVHGRFGPGETATSHLLPGFAVDVTAALAAKP